MMQEYKKTYKGLVLWAVGYILLASGGGALLFLLFPELDSGAGTKIILILTLLALDGLMLLIKRGGTVYWINGVSYLNALVAGAERRTAFAEAHLRLFLNSTYWFLGYCLLALLLQLPTFVDILAFLAVVLAAAFRSVAIKL